MLGVTLKEGVKGRKKLHEEKGEMPTEVNKWRERIHKEKAEGFNRCPSINYILRFTRTPECVVIHRITHSLSTYYVPGFFCHGECGIEQNKASAFENSL